MPETMEDPGLKLLLKACNDDPVRLCAYVTNQTANWLTTLHMIGIAIERGDLPGIPGVADKQASAALIHAARNMTEQNIDALYE
jgi:hypothetical protein